jgi:gliding motility-associated-like protein
MNESANSTASFGIQSNTSWSVIPDTSSWLTITPAIGAGTGTISLVADENLTGAHRTATITVKGIEARDTTIIVYQAAPPPVGVIDIMPIDPTRCGEKGILIITIDGGTEGDIYDIDYTNDGMFDARDTVHNNALTIRDVPVGTRITNLVLSNIYNKVQSLSLASTSIQGPPNTIITGVAYINMINCVKQGTIQISITGASEGDNYNIDLNNDGSIDRTSLVSSGKLTLNNITGGQTYTGLSIMNPLTSCSDTSTTAIVVNPDLTQVTGDQNLCPGSQNVPYQVDYNNQCTYTWQVTGGTLVAGSQPSEISVNWSENRGIVQLIRGNTVTGCRDTSLLTVSLADTTKPQIVNCLPEYHVESMYTENTLYYIFNNTDQSIIPTATDNCPISNLIYSFNYNGIDYHELSEFPGYRITKNGQDQMKWTISDHSGNATTCATTIIFETNRIVPSAFSPNGDLMNDVWNIKFLKQYPNSIVKVFNRWGIAIYESEKGYPASWDGRRNGELVPVDSYYYVISMGDDSASMQGYVTVIY